MLAWNDKGTALTYKIGGVTLSAPSIFDTGESTTTLYTGGIPAKLRASGQLRSGLPFAAVLGSNTTSAFTTGNTANVNKVQIGPTRKAGTVNTGIGIFFSFDVMYDIKHGTIGFRPAANSG